jgi:hypothetical protein
MLTHLLFALDFPQARTWAAQAAGIAAAGLVLMVGRFLAHARRSRSVPPATPPAPAADARSASAAPAVDSRWHRRSEPQLKSLLSELTYKVEETWK